MSRKILLLTDEAFQALIYVLNKGSFIMLLIVSRKKSHAQTIANMIRFTGIVCFPATPVEALSEIGTMYRAVVVLEPDTLPDARDFVKRIHSYHSTVPVFALYEGKKFESLPYFNGSYSAATYSATFASKLSAYAVSNGLPSIGDYKLAGINATPGLHDILFFNKPVKLSRTEAMILRFLIRSYPIPQKSKSIIKYIYKPSDAPEESSMRTHICSINKKFYVYTGFPLIRSVTGKGYIICTPDAREKYSISL